MKWKLRGFRRFFRGFLAAALCTSLHSGFVMGVSAGEVEEQVYSQTVLEPPDENGWFKFPESVITNWKVQVKGRSESGWRDYNENMVIDGNTDIRVQCWYDHLPSTILEESNGMLTIPIPSTLQSAEGPLGSPLEHLQDVNGVQESITLGYIQQCEKNLNHVHLNFSNYSELVGTELTNGSFYLNLKPNLQEIWRGGPTEFTLAGKTVQLNFQDRIYERHLDAGSLQKIKETDENDSNIELKEDAIYLSFKVTVNTNDDPLPNVVIDDVMEWNYELCEDYDLSSFQFGKTGELEPVDESRIAMNLPDGERSSLVYTADPSFQEEEVVSHPVPLHSSGRVGLAFSFFAGSLEANSSYELHYKVRVSYENIERYLKGGPRKLHNYAALNTSEIRRLRTNEVETVLNAAVSVEKSQTQAGIHKDEYGNIFLPYTLHVQAHDDNSYPFYDLPLTDEVILKNALNGQAMNNIEEFVSFEDLEVTKHLKDGTDEAITPETELEESENGNRKKVILKLGTFDPGESADVQYMIRIDAGIASVMGVQDIEQLLIVNQAQVSASATINGGTESYNSNQAVTNTQLDIGSLLKKIAPDEITEDVQTISMNESDVYDGAGNPLDETEFLVPSGAIRYVVDINASGQGNAADETFTDTLSSDAFIYTGFVQVNAMVGGHSQIQEGQTSSTEPSARAFIQVDGLSSFEFRPSAYPALKELEENTEGNISYQLTYFVYCPAASDTYILDNEIAGTVTVGNGSQPVKLSLKQKVSKATASGLSINAGKQALLVIESENPPHGYENGEIYWLIRVDSRLIPAGTVFEDILQQGSGVGGVNSHFADGALRGVYQAEDVFAQAPFNGFGSLTSRGEQRAYTMEEVNNALSGYEVDESCYSSALKTANPTRELDIEIEKTLTLEEDEYLYFLVCSTPDEAHAHITGDRSSKRYGNTLSYSFHDGEKTLLASAVMHQRHFNTISKSWNGDLIYDDETLQYLNTNQGRDIPNVWKNAAGLNALLAMYESMDVDWQSHSFYTDWRIQVNTDSTYPMSHDGTMEIVERLPANSSYVKAVLVKEKNGSNAVTPTLSDLSMTATVEESGGGQIVRLSLEGVQAGQEVSVHLITQLNKDWNEILALPEDAAARRELNLTNQADLYFNGSHIGTASATSDPHINGVLEKTGPSATGGRILPFSIVLNEAEIDLLPDSDSVNYPPMN